MATALLSEKELTLKDSDVKERARALAELKSLMMAAMIAPKLEAFDLEREIVKTMSERFPGDPVVIGWRLRQHGQVFGAPFIGRFERADGKTVRFPMDFLGTTTVLYFWSKENDGEEDLKALAAAWTQGDASSCDAVRPFATTVKPCQRHANDGRRICLAGVAVTEFLAIGTPEDAQRTFQTELKTLDGETVKIP